MTLTLASVGSADCLSAVTTHLSAFFDQKERSAAPYGRHFAQLWTAARVATEGGKKIRPALVVNTHRALAGSNDHDAIVVATAFELLHTAFLLHDDVIDEDTVRRGRPNLAGRFSEQASNRGVDEARATTWGQASAILAGDLLIHSAQNMVARLNLPQQRRIALLDLLEESTFVTVAGELADVAFSTNVAVPVLSQVLAMTQWKTAHYSFQAPLQAGAILAGASAETTSLLSEFGRLVGIAFQLRDDILGLFGTGQAIGKSVVSDLREGKLTPLMFHAQQISSTNELRDIIAQENITDADAERVRHLVELSGARAFIENLTNDYAQAAVDVIQSAAIPATLRAQLRDVAQTARDRTS
ncbi:MAG: polyprenyl synthetase family protein [Microbacteriaceae bacterium]